MIRSDSKRNPQGSASQRKHEAFRKQLPNETCALRPECLPYGELARPCRRSSQQKVRNVGARDEQYGGDQRHQHLQWIGELSAYIGDPCSHWSERQVGLIKLRKIPLVGVLITIAQPYLMKENVRIGGGLLERNAGLQPSHDEKARRAIV